MTSPNFRKMTKQDLVITLEVAHKMIQEEIADCEKTMQEIPSIADHYRSRKQGLETALIYLGNRRQQ